MFVRPIVVSLPELLFRRLLLVSEAKGLFQQHRPPVLGRACVSLLDNQATAQNGAGKVCSVFEEALKRAGVISTPICCNFAFMGAALFSKAFQ